MSNSVTIEDSKGETFAEVIDVIGVSEVKKAFQQSVKEGSLHNWFKGSKSKDGEPGWVNVVTKKKMKEGYVGTRSGMGGSSILDHEKDVKSGKLTVSKIEKKQGPRQLPKNYKPLKDRLKEDIKRDEYGDPIGGPKISKKQKAKNLAKNEPDRDHTTDTAESVDYIDLPLEVEIPNTDATFKLGLMFRESLEINKGMLFIFEEVGKRSFHMRNTRIPLDIAFVKEDGTIESIKELTPYSSLPVYSDGEVLFAIEANRGWFTENNVEVGDEIVLGEENSSGTLVKYRKKGAAKCGNKSESVEIDEAMTDYGSQTARDNDDNKAAVAARKRIYDRASEKDKNTMDARTISQQRNKVRDERMKADQNKPEVDSVGSLIQKKLKVGKFKKMNEGVSNWRSEIEAWNC